MMIITGHLASSPEAKERRDGSGGKYYTMRVAENYGSDERRTTIWFDVVASISELDADLLTKGMAVRIDGKLDPEAYISKQALAGMTVPTTWDGVIAMLKQQKALKVGLKLITNSRGLKPHSFENPQETAPQPKSDAPVGAAAPF